jgi:VanZ family protein
MNINTVLPDRVHLHRHFDKFAHFMMYGTLSFVFFIENFNNKYSIRKFWIIFDTITIGIFIEFLQYLVTNYRSGNFYDAVFNTFGVIAGSILFLLLKDFPFVY